MTDERHNASIRIQALHPQYAAAAAQWASRLGLKQDGETEFALQLGDDGLQLVELGDKAPGPDGWISSRGRRRIGASSAAAVGR